MELKGNDETTEPSRPLTHWWEEDAIGTEKVKAFTIILRSRGCTFSKVDACTMCGYNISSPPCIVGTGEYLNQIRSVANYLSEARYIKIFTSGSFTDPAEVPPEAREGMIDIIHRIAPESRLLIESRPEFITYRVMDEMLERHPNIEVAIGLESSDDLVRQRMIGKRFDLGEYFRAADIIVEKKAHLKTYLVMKPPFMSESGSISDTIRSIFIISERYPGSTVSVNPINVQRGTPVEALSSLGNYRPPWLWSLVTVLKSGKRISGGRLRIISFPTGAGRSRGAHNCGKCDPRLLEEIHRFDITNDELDLPSPTCCYGSWIQALSTVI